MTAERAPQPWRPALEALAARLGAMTAYRGVGGSVHRADHEALTAVLAALGAPLTRPCEAPEALAELAARQGHRPIEPVVALRAAQPLSVGVELPRDLDPRRVWVVLELEDGEVRHLRLAAGGRPTGSGSRGDGPAEGSAEGSGEGFERYELRLGAPGAPPIPEGYHRLRIEAPRLAAESLVICAGRVAAPRRGWGPFQALHALRSEDDRGVGTYTDLARVAAWAGSFGASFVGTLPLYPTHLSAPSDPSPYRPLSRLALSELFVDPTAVPELDHCPEARRLVSSTVLRGGLEGIRGSALVDYPAVMDAQRRILELLADALHAEPSRRRTELERFMAEHPELEAYAAFRAASDAAGKGAGAALPEGAVDQRSLAYHRYAQWVASQQLAAVGMEHPGTGLYLDLPIGVHPEGFDPHWEPGAFARGVHAGAPPDAFFAGGQDWAVPPLHPHGVRHDGYCYLIAVLRHALRYAQVLRVDHVMGLHRLYWIPEGWDARHGVYVRYPAAELRAVAVLEAERAGAAVVGEDLGTVPGGVRAAMAQDGMLRSWVFAFEATAERPLPDPPDGAMASMGTHDLPPFASFWSAGDIDEREQRGLLEPASAERERRQRAVLRRRTVAELRRRGLLASPPDEGPPDPRDVLRGCLSHMAAGPARLVTVDLEDLWLERRPQNRPGTGAGVGNWARRSARTLEQARADPRVTAVLAELEARRREGSPLRSAPASRADAAPAASAGCTSATPEPA
jgi:4-alpha-glucanotransferase